MLYNVLYLVQPSGTLERYYALIIYFVSGVLNIESKPSKGGRM